MNSGVFGGRLGAAISRQLIARYGKRKSCAWTAIASVLFGLLLLALGAAVAPTPGNRRAWMLLSGAFFLMGVGQLVYAWRMKPTGLVDGRHHSTHAARIRYLMRQGDTEGAETLLLRLITATEEEARTNDWPVEPRYYEELARLYRISRHQAKEREVLERYVRFATPPSRVPHTVTERLETLRALRGAASGGA